MTGDVLLEVCAACACGDEGLSGWEVAVSPELCDDECYAQREDGEAAIVLGGVVCPKLGRAGANAVEVGRDVCEARPDISLEILVGGDWFEEEGCGARGFSKKHLKVVKGHS